MGTLNRNFKNKFVEELISDIANNESSYYVAFGYPYPWDDDSNPPAVNTSLKTSYYDVSKSLIDGKKVTVSDVAYMTRRVNWAANTVYIYYSHLDPDLYSKDFYVINSSNRVYKCLYNNNGGKSTVEPTGISSFGDFDTADGYKWKYLYTIQAADMNKFSTDDYIPVLNTTPVAAAAETGAIHVIVVENGGNNYLFSTGPVEQTVNSFCFRITNTATSTTAGSYNNSLFYVGGIFSDGASPIQDYVINSSGRFVITQEEITITSAASYTICPQIKIVGDGSGAGAICSVNAITGSITSVQVIDRGLDYRYSTIDVIANTYYGSNAYCYPIISPKDGHGSDIQSEIGADVIGISVSTKPTDNLYRADWLSYRQASLIYNPKQFANGNALYTSSVFKQLLEIDITNVYGIMPFGETVTGFNSGATGTVIYMDTTKLYLFDIEGRFFDSEILSGATSGITCSSVSINNPDINKYSGEVFYYKNFEPITREDLFSEQVQLYFKY